MEHRADMVVASTALLTRSTRKQLHLVALNFRVPFELRQKLKAHAVERAMTMTDVLVAALRTAGVLEQD